MPGVKGAGGPPPKRTDQRRRRNKTAAEERGGVRAGEAIPAEQPEPGDWVFGVRQWYESLGKTGVSGWYSAADWSSAWLMAETMNREFTAEGVLKSATMMAWLKLNAALLATEGDRRRAAVELAKPAPPDDGKQTGVTSLASWKKSVGT